VNSAAVIIGAMVISPLLYSIIGIAASIFFLDFKQLIKELLSLLLEISLILLVIFIFGKLFEVQISTEITNRIESSNMDYFLIAFFSGVAGSFALFWPKIKQSLVGVAISVALIPPIVLCGIGLTQVDKTLVLVSMNIVLTNLLGIGLGSVSLLLLLRFKKLLKQSS
jgi:uncharacterized hydrophobic protein (TIGR00271 family)